MFPEKQLEKLEKENKQLKQKIKEYEEREKIREIEKKLKLKYYIEEEELNAINSDEIMAYFQNHFYYFGINLFKVIKEYGWELLEKAFIEVYNKKLKEKERKEKNE